MGDAGRQLLEDRLAALRLRADEDFAGAPGIREQGRHTLDVDDLGIRVSITRARYPNTRDGVDQYAVTISRHRLDHAPAEPEVNAVLTAAFGVQMAGLAAERRGGPMVRMFRVPATA